MTRVAASNAPLSAPQRRRDVGFLLLGPVGRLCSAHPQRGRVPISITSTPARGLRLSTRPTMRHGTIGGGARVEAQQPADRLELLDRQECFELLADVEVGRLGFVVDGQPRIEPVNYRLVDGDVVFMSRPGAKLDAAVHGQRVAFEIDAVEEWARAGWSVLAVGVASVVSDPVQLADLAAQGAEAWAPTSELSVVRIAVADVTGRRVRVHPGGVTLLRQDPDVPRPAW
jgi:uncharacterized protein